ncbi:MAG: hypothetical protein GY792_24910 [Gammaproteobacteria bacterium]|nr:hypothetical protein [Gammaproteobacteria bacterium]
MRQSSAPNSLPRQANDSSATDQSSCLIWIGEVKADGLANQTHWGVLPRGGDNAGQPVGWLTFALGALAAGLQLGQIATWGWKLECR